MKLSFAPALLVAVMTCCLYGQLENGSFESGLDNWTASGFTAEVFTDKSFTPDNTQPVTIDPVQGNSFVVLKSGGGSIDTNFSEIYQDITVSAGQTIKGVFFFATQDYLNWNDQAYIRMQSFTTPEFVIPLASSSVEVVGNYGSMEGWGRFEHTFLAEEAGSYRLVANVHDELDNILSSYLAVDNMTLTPTPEPATMTLLGLGALAFRTYRKS